MTISSQDTEGSVDSWLPLPAEAWHELPDEWRTAMDATSAPDPVEPGGTPEEETGGGDGAGAPDPTTPDIPQPSPPDEDTP